MSAQTVGRHNPRLAEIRRSLRSGELTPDGLLPVEGGRMIVEAARSGIEIVETFVREGDPEGFWAGACRTVKPAVFESLSPNRAPQGPIALIRPPVFGTAWILDRAPALLVVVCGLQDPGNVGTMLRSAEAFSATGFIAVEGTVSLYNDKVVRSSAGSLFRLPHVMNVSFDALIPQLKARRIPVVGTGAEGGDRLDTLDWSQPAAILFGNEGAGLSHSEREVCDRLVSIPHSRAVNSLNAAVAAAIILHEASRVREFEDA